MVLKTEMPGSVNIKPGKQSFAKLLHGDVCDLNMCLLLLRGLWVVS